jgi:hypothetical protein
MFTLWGSTQRFCDGITRRNFLRIGAFGAGLSLAEMLRHRATAGTTAATASKKSAIMIYLAGGPSHIDMYDLKPDAPVEYRGEFKPIPTNVPGVQICEHFPLQAKMWDKFACIRSVIARDGAHTDVEISTGYKSQAGEPSVNHPSFGSFVSRLRGNSPVPPYVCLHPRDFSVSKGLGPGYLGSAHQAFTPSGPSMDNLRLPKDITLDRLEDRKQLLAGFDSLRRDIDSNGAMAGMDSFARRAFDMVASGSVCNALDLTQEAPSVRARYQKIEQFLLARRLVEAGVGCVTLSVGDFLWDSHEKNFSTLRRLLPDVDRGLCNLIQDLHDRGLDQDVVTVMWGEFGRTPKIDKNAGRGHWSPAMSVLVAGGGLKMGQMVGATTARAEVPRDRPYYVPHVLATAYRVMGIDPSMTILHPSGRPMYILDDREPVTELL